MASNQSEGQATTTRQLNMLQVLVVAMIAFILAALVIWVFKDDDSQSGHSNSADAQSERQIALAAIMYGGDHDDRMVPTINGPLDQLQNVADGHLTTNCPGPGTQDLQASDAAGGRRTDTWVLLLLPYFKTAAILTDPNRGDVHRYYWIGTHDYMTGKFNPLSVGQSGYNPEGSTYRNVGRFPMYGVNYMFLSPLRIPKNKLKRANAINYAEAEAVDLDSAADPAQTVFFTDSQRSQTDTTRGFFVVNAPGMWPTFSDDKNGYVAFWNGTKGSGDWVGTPTACNDFSNPCPTPTTSTNFAYMYKGGTNTTFVDGHVKHMKAEALAAGTNYLAATAGSAGSLGSGAVITDIKHYLWDLK